MLTTALLLLWSTGLLAQDPGEESRHAAPEKQIVFLDSSPHACPYCDLEGLNLSGRDLTNANLTGANLRGGDFRGATLKGISLSGADLENANFDRAKVKNTDLSRTNLRGATFRGAEIHHTDFQYADLKGADFSSTDLSAVVFGPKIHAGVLPDGRKTSFRGAQLRRDFEFDGTTMDLRKVVWVGDPHGHTTGDSSEEETVCGKADLSVLTSRIYVGNTGTDSNSCGASYASPCKTIQKGIERCAAGGCGVLVAWGEYSPTASVGLAQGKNLYGGCLPKHLARPDYFSVITGPKGGLPAVTADNIHVATQVQGFQLVGSPGPSLPVPNPSKATTAVYVSSSTALTLANVEVLAGKGGTGGTGQDGKAGPQGGDAKGRKGGNSDWRFTEGGDGAHEMGVRVDVGGFDSSCEAICENN